MHRDFRLYIDDILDAVCQIRIYTEGLDEAAFKKDREKLRNPLPPSGLKIRTPKARLVVKIYFIV